MNLTDEQRKEAEELLETAQICQIHMWDALNDLERILGFDVAADDISEGVTLDHLLVMAEINSDEEEEEN